MNVLILAVFEFTETLTLLVTGEIDNDGEAMMRRDKMKRIK